MISKLGELLDGTLRRAGLEATSAICQIAESWGDIVGPRVATRAAPIRLLGDELTLSAPDPVWRQELTLLGPEIATRVNQNLQKKVVRRVKLVTGAVRSPDPGRAKRRLINIATTRAPQESFGPAPEPAAPPADASAVDVATALTKLAQARWSRLEADRKENEASRANALRRTRQRSPLHPWTRRRGRRVDKPGAR